MTKVVQVPGSIPYSVAATRKSWRLEPVKMCRISSVCVLSGIAIILANPVQPPMSTKHVGISDKPLKHARYAV